MAIGADLRAYAQSLPVPPDYTGPPYNGPSSVNDAFVDHLLNMYKTQAKLPMKYSYLMALDVLDILKQEKSLQRVAVPPGSKITVVGDIHGQYFDFVHMIEQVTGKPSPQNPILFNGDFVDRGPWSVEVLLCLYAFKLQYPTAVHFNRGNHESEMTNYQYGFANEVKVKYEDKLMELFSETFRYLPLATVLENQVFVSHAGVPGPQERLWEDWMQKAPDEAAGVLRRDQQVTLAEIEATNRVCEPNPMDFPLVIDFLWSDPKGANGYGPSTRVPMVYTFGPDVAQRFLQANNLKYMLRSHETKSAGFQETIPNVITVFSAPNYIDRAGNLAAVAVLTNQGGNLDKQFPVFAISYSPVEAVTQADQQFVTQAEELKRPGSTWSYEVDRYALRAVLEGSFRREAAYADEHRIAARSQQSTVEIISRRFSFGCLPFCCSLSSPEAFLFQR
ncbi:Serine/threonine-protein phosphatase 5 [Durusdinium trenchii]|uniref:Serine/threonine-protein phosphatase n=1 Tax=Durusdinium trenchii TaxID=1381693 RepID=A0ABP0JXI5_9DINO